MLSHANASPLNTTRCFSDSHHVDNNQQQHQSCSPDVSQESTRHRWYFDESGQLVSPKGACYTIAPSILKSQSHDAFNYNKPTLASVTPSSSSSLECGQPNGNNKQKHDNGQQQPMTTSHVDGGDKEKENGSPHTTTISHPHHQHHQSHRRKRSRRYRGRKGNNNNKDVTDENDIPNATTQTLPSSSSPQHSLSTTTTTTDQLTLRLWSLSMSSSTSSSPPAPTISTLTNITTDKSAHSGSTNIDKYVSSSFPASISSAAMDINIGSCGIDDRKHSELGGSHESSTQQQAKSNTTTEKKQRLYKTELCRNWEELQICRYGDKCQYAHGLEDLRDVERHPKYKTQVCRTFYQTGTCPYGTRCTFRHDENGLLASTLNQRTPPSTLFHHHRHNRTCTYMTPAAWMTNHADATQAPPTSDSNHNVVLSSDAESLLPTGLLSDLDEPPSHIRPPVVGSTMLPCIPSSLLFQHGQQVHSFHHNIWKQQHQGSDIIRNGDHGTSIPSFL